MLEQGIILQQELLLVVAKVAMGERLQSVEVIYTHQAMRAVPLLEVAKVAVPEILLLREGW